MKSSGSIVKIASALLKAQKQMEGAKKGAINPFFRSKYADYGAVLEACKEHLNDNGITILQPHCLKEFGGFAVGVVETILLHESGEYISSETEIKCLKPNDPQSLGSSITYARRYGLQSIVALPAEDDDGNKGSGLTKPPKDKTPKKPVVKTPPKTPEKKEIPKKKFERPSKVEETPVETNPEASWD
jgi:hypothetical protein